MDIEKILQLVDASNLCVSGRGVNRAFFSLLSEFEDLVGNPIIGLFVIGLFKKLFLEHLQSFVDTIQVQVGPVDNSRCISRKYTEVVGEDPAAIFSVMKRYQRTSAEK